MKFFSIPVPAISTKSNKKLHFSKLFLIDRQLIIDILIKITDSEKKCSKISEKTEKFFDCFFSENFSHSPAMDYSLSVFQLFGSVALVFECNTQPPRLPMRQPANFSVSGNAQTYSLA